MSPFWILLELRMMEVVVKTGAARLAKLQSNRHRQPKWKNYNMEYDTQTACTPDSLLRNSELNKSKI